MKTKMFAALLLIALCLSACAGSLAQEKPFVFRNGVTWDSTIYEFLESEGEWYPHTYLENEYMGYAVSGVTYGDYPARLDFLFLEDRLAAISCDITGYDDVTVAFASLQDLLAREYGLPNLEQPDRLLAVFTAMGMPPEIMPDFDSIPWAGWVLEDENTLILLADIGSLGIVYFNEARLTGREAAVPQASAAPPATGEAQTRGFDTPETCARAVAQALINGDTQAFLNCYAIAETARGFNLAAQIDKYGAMQLGNSLFQPVSGFDIAYNEAHLTQNLLMRVAGAARLLANPDFGDLWGRSFPLSSYTLEELLALADTGDRLSRLIYQGTLAPSKADERYPDALSKNSSNYEIYGMEDWHEIIVLLDLEGRAMVLPLALVRYDAGWLAAPFTPVIGLLLGVPSYTLLIAENML